jgi:hypothetical protein
MRTGNALALALSAALTLSCGTTGSDADSGVDTDADNSDASGGGPDGAVAVLTSIDPDWGPLVGGTEVTITGSGFTGNGNLTVTFGANDGTDVNVVSDTELTVVTPNGPHARVDVTVTNDNGTSGGLNFRYLASLYAAPSMGHRAGSLYVVNAENANTIAVGDLGVPITGMAISPDGILFGIETAPGGGKLAVVPGVPTTAQLYTINPYTAVPTLVGGVVNDLAGEYSKVADIAFEGDRLFGWAEQGPEGNDYLIEIDPATAVATSLGTPTGFTSGSGLASNGSGTLYAHLGGGGELYTITLAGVLTAGPVITPGGSFNGLTFIDGVIYGCNKAGGGGAVAPGVIGTASELVTINASTGAMVVVGPLPADIDSLASPPTIAAAAAPAPPVAAPPAARAPTHVTPPAPRVPDTLTVRAGRQVLVAGSPKLVDLTSTLAGVKGKALEIASATDSVRFDLTEVRARGLQLKLNQRGRYKLMDGAGIKLGEGIVSIRIVD